MRKKFAIAFGVSAILLAASQSEAMPAAPQADRASLTIQIANGCGRGGYRGPYGSCHRFGTGPYPGGYSGPYYGAQRWNGCPPGYWRGPWGHCRDTPYHGRLPGGGWK